MAWRVLTLKTVSSLTGKTVVNWTLSVGSRPSRRMEAGRLAFQLRDSILSIKNLFC